jgi:hypothetical protein
VTADADAATITLDLSVSRLHSVTLSGNHTIALSNTPATGAFTIIVNYTGNFTPTWDASTFSTIKWPLAVSPTYTSINGKADAFTFIKRGTGDFLGFVAGQNI